MKILTLLILILATLMPRSIGHSQVTDAGTIVGQGEQMAKCQNLSDVTNPVEGLEIYCVSDKLIHCYSNGNWSKYMDSTSVSNSPHVTSVTLSSTDMNITTPTVTSSGTISETIKPAYKIQRFGTHASTTLPLKYWDTIIVSPSTAQGDSINFSYVGFTTIPVISCTAQYNTVTAGACPQTSLKTWSTTGCSVSITNGNSSVVTLLSTVLSLGAATNYATANLASISICITAQGF